MLGAGLAREFASKDRGGRSIPVTGFGLGIVLRSEDGEVTRRHVVVPTSFDRVCRNCQSRMAILLLSSWELSGYWFDTRRELGVARISWTAVKVRK